MPTTMTDVVQVIDRGCGPDVLLEAYQLAGESRGYLCLGAPAEAETWSELVSRREILATVPTSALLARRVGGLRRLPRDAWAARCWTIASARRLVSLGLWPVPLIVLRLTEPPNPRQAGELAELGLSSRLGIACQSVSLARAVRGADVLAEVEVIDPPAEAPAPVETRPALREKLGIAEGEIAILAPGQAHRESGHRFAVWATAILAVAEMPARLILQETGAGARDALRFAQDAGFRDRVVVAGAQVSLAELASAADAAVFLGVRAVPGVAAATAMAAGLPIVAGNIPAATDWLTDGHNALLVQPDAPRQIAQALMRIMEDRSLAGRLGAAARASAAGRPDGAGVSRSWRQLIEQLRASAESQSRAKGPAPT